MSTCARAERRRAQRAMARRDARYREGAFVVAGWCSTDDQLDECRRQLHDVVINGLTENRTAVEWVWFRGDEASDALRQIREGATGALADHYRRIGAMLREYGGILVVAIAAGTPR